MVQKLIKKYLGRGRSIVGYGCFIVECGFFRLWGYVLPAGFRRRCERRRFVFIIGIVDFRARNNFIRLLRFLVSDTLAVFRTDVAYRYPRKTENTNRDDENDRTSSSHFLTHAASFGRASCCSLHELSIVVVSLFCYFFPPITHEPTFPLSTAARDVFL